MQDTSFPCAAFIWSIENKSDAELEVSITFAFKNGQGDIAEDTEGGVWSEPFEHRASGKAGVARATGVTIHQKFRYGTLKFCFELFYSMLYLCTYSCIGFILY